MTTPDAQYPDNQTDGHDLDPNADGDRVVTVPVEHTAALLVAVHSDSSEAVSVSVTWLTDDGNTTVTETATELDLSGVTNDWARLTRKGPRAEVTLTSDAGAGTTNVINSYVGAHR